MAEGMSGQMNESLQEIQRRKAWARQCWRYGLPLMLMAVGWWLWHLGVAMPGAPVVMPELYPTAIAIDKSGNLYVADHNNHCVWKVSRWDQVKKVAGYREYGCSGDGGPAVKARLECPHGIALDSEDNLYISDTNNDRIRKVDKAGIITTVAGSDKYQGGDGGKAVRAGLSVPEGIVFDAQGNLYITDSYNSRVRKVDKAGIITTVAGNGVRDYQGDGKKATKASLIEPYGIAFDAEGNLYIADAGSACVRRVDKTGVITTVVGTGEWSYSGDGGKATKAKLSQPFGITFDAKGNFYIADESNNRIRKVDRTGIVTTVAGNGDRWFGGDGWQAVKASLAEPNDVTTDVEGNLYIADFANLSVRKVNKVGIITTIVTGKSRFRR